MSAMHLPAKGQLSRIGATSLYKPDSGETYAFLLWTPDPQRERIALDQTWADQGAPPLVGWYVFLLSAPAGADAAELESRLRGVLPPPSVTSLAWASDSPAAFELLAALALKLGPTDQPMLADDVPLVLPPGILCFTFAKNLCAMRMDFGAGDLTGVILATPRPPSAAGASGLALPLLGPCAGCIHFTGARESTVTGDASVKPLADVLLDPLRLTDARRTRIRLTGLDYVLSKDGAGYHFFPASAPGAP
jgi:hypothetical protein